jgi:olfactory receptor
MVVITAIADSIIYIKLKSLGSLGQDRLISVTYSVLIPLLNPGVYSLRSKDAVCRRILMKKVFNPQCNKLLWLLFMY